MTSPSNDDLIRMYERQAIINATDERFRQGILRGDFAMIYYSPRGQECISAALGVHLRSDDYLVTTYRGLHDQLGKGIPLGELVAEYLGRASGPCGGKGGPMHVTHAQSGVMVTTGIVAGGLPIANGLALATSLDGGDRVTAVCFGDGATNNGAFHEAVNLAAVWNLPIVFVCQNNQYGEHTPVAATMRVDTVAQRAAAYGIPAARVDGNDPIALWHTVGEAVKRARDGGGPTLVEALTYRFYGHVFGESLDYQPAAEREAAIADDPHRRFRIRLVEEYNIDETVLAEIEARTGTRVAEAFASAAESPEPELSALYTDVITEGVL